MKKFLIGIIVSLFSTITLAQATWVCNFDEFKSSTEKIYIINQIYSSRTVVIQSSNLTACLMPLNSPETEAAFRLPGLLSKNVLARLYQTSLVDRNIKLVYSVSSMYYCVIDNKPSVGYLPPFGVKDVNECFSE
jgi:hypothetical protein